MKFLVSRPKKPENSPLYSIHTDLDSFILCNDESLEEPEFKNRHTNNETEPKDCNIMATLDPKENDAEMYGQCTKIEIQSEP